jgi:hypothetical protein
VLKACAAASGMEVLRESTNDLNAARTEAEKPVTTNGAPDYSGMFECPRLFMSACRCCGQLDDMFTDPLALTLR